MDIVETEAGASPLLLVKTHTHTHTHTHTRNNTLYVGAPYHLNFVFRLFDFLISALSQCQTKELASDSRRGLTHGALAHTHVQEAGLCLQEDFKAVHCHLVTSLLVQENFETHCIMLSI